MEITTIAGAGTMEDLVLLIEAANERYEWLKTKAPKMPKAKALEMIAKAYPDYEVTDVYTVKANLESAHGQVIAAAGVREVALKTAETIGTLLVELANTQDAKTKKNIRAALRRQGYYVSSEKKEEAE